MIPLRSINVPRRARISGYRLLYHSTSGLRVIKKKNKDVACMQFKRMIPLRSIKPQAMPILREPQADTLDSASPGRYHQQCDVNYIEIRRDIAYWLP
jgi:hypothetical protein